jgi:hypothetical protein
MEPTVSTTQMKRIDQAGFTGEAGIFKSFLPFSFLRLEQPFIVLARLPR